MANSLDDVVRQMAAVGIGLPARADLTQAFKGFYRWRPPDEKKVKKSAWARLFEFTGKTGRVFITGSFGWRGDTYTVEASASDWSPAERAEWQAQRKAAEKAAEEARQSDAVAAAEKAQRLWAKGREEGAHPYLDRKRVRAFGVRFLRDMLLVPVRDMAGTLQGLQYISGDGEKKFGSGMLKAGRFHLIGEVSPDKPLAFAEGYASGASAHMATGWPVVVCFDAGNLDGVMAQWRELYPELQFAILADDDRHLVERLSGRLAKAGVHVDRAVFAREAGGLRAMEWELPDGTVVSLKAGMANDAAGVSRIEGSITVGDQVQLLKLENAGRAKAVAAAKRHRALVLLPPFEGTDTPDTDWNDFHVGRGLEACAEALLRLFEDGGLKKSRANGGPQGGRGRRGAASDDGEPPPQSDDFLARFTLIYGTTTVWDAVERQVYRIESLKLAFGRLVDWWLDHPNRRMVPQHRLVFDPTGRSQAPDYVNLFAGLAVKPDPSASCARIVEHLFNICQENDELFHWVACWLALPLQKLGTKMHTALVLHGREEGTGKSLLAGIMRRIYGVHSRSIGQRQLETEFNGWLSGQMYVVAEEVVSRQDRAHLQGILQDMIVNETVQINEKNMPLRTEANFANFQFHSNQQVPVLLNKSDRRHTVIRVEARRPPEYFDAILEEMDNGGVAAFLDWLLRYDIGDFNNRTRPFQNKDRMHLITLGMSPDQRFFQFWESGVAGVPFVTCPASDLYTAFKAWCRINGERFVANSTAFGRTMSEELERLGAPEKRKTRYWAYSDKTVADGDWSNSEPTQLQGIVYFVPADRERRSVTAGDDTAPAPQGESVDVTQPEVRDARIKLFQAALHTLLGNARRAM